MYNIVNLTTYRQFTNAAWIIVLGLFKEKKKKERKKKRKEKKSKLHQGWAFPIPISTTKDVNNMLL